jgi:predicted nucleic acid-binding protein
VRLVVDASAASYLATSARGFQALEAHELHAPPLLWSEVTAAVHQQVWRGVLSASLGRGALEQLTAAPITPSDDHVALLADAWDIADRLGWAKTYDAEYVALTIRLNAALLTRDARLRRGVRQLIETADPFDL